MMTQDAEKRSYLVVDDDADILALLGGIWGDEVDVVTCTTVERACVELEEKVFDLVFLDIHLPDGDGTMLLEDLRAGAFDELNRDAPVIMLSASVRADDYEAAWDLDALAYVTKPISIPTLQSAVDRGQRP